MNALNEKLRLEYLEAMGIQVWQTRLPIAGMQIISKEASTPDIPEIRRDKDLASNSASLPDADEITSQIRWKKLESCVASCTACELHATRTQTVFGTGSHTAKWMVIGEAPGASEDQQGKPFVGRAGQLLTEMLRAVGLEREEVFIANILKCRPPNNRDPEPDEVESCEGFLKQQVAMVKPKIILAAGRIAAQNLLKTDTPISRLRGRVHRYADIPLVVVYHPAYLLRSPLEKRKAWEDLQLAMNTIDAGEKE
ncbi:MAG: uracil-DNA glycosylase [Methylococcaceae bacterium]|nr:uracil-DNA glycosylase [Methylococcaceae bacterium]